MTLRDRLNKTTGLVLFASIALAMAIFVVDLATPLGITEWVFYLLPLLLLSQVFGQPYLSLLAAFCTGLVALGYVFSPPGMEPRLALLNRSMDVGVLWLATGLITWRQRAEAERARLLAQVQTYAEELETANEELQDQTLELEVQAGELEEANAQLQAQAVELQEKTEELEVQTEELTSQNEELVTLMNELETERARLKTLSDQLRVNEQHFQLALKNSQILVFNQDKDLRYTWVYNPQLGRSPQDVLGKTDAELMSCLEEARQLTEIKRRVLENRVGVREEVKITHDGRATFWDLTVEPLYDSTGNVAAITGATMDITARKWMEQALSLSEERYRSFIALSSEAIWRLELEEGVPTTLPVDEQIDLLYRYGYLAECNQVTAKVFGLGTTDEMIGTRLGSILPRLSSQNLELLRDFIRAGYRVTEAEAAEVDRHGRVSYFLNSLVGVIEDGCLGRVWFIKRDVTERKRAEEVLRSQAWEMAGLEERQRLARDLHDSVSQALYGIALGTRTARSQLERNDPKQVMGALDYCLSLAETGLAELRALIFDLRPESLATDGLVAALEKRASFIHKRQGVDVNLELSGEPDVPENVKETLYSIAREAMHNTVKHARARRIELKLAQTGEEMVLDVRDDGSGFDPSGEFAGHLGLKSMRERAAFVGGTVTIESRPGKGTRVEARIPTKVSTMRQRTETGVIPTQGRSEPLA